MAWSQAAREAAEQARQSHQAGVEQVGKQPMTLAPESEASSELRQFADNDSDLYRQSMQPIRDALGKKMDKGQYDPAKATKLYGYHADRAAKAYAKQFGTSFSPAVRREAAAHWEADERGDIASGASRSAK